MLKRNASSARGSWRARHAVAAVAVIVIASCGGSGDGVAPPQPEPLAVSETVVQGEATQEISVWAPDTEGPWPVVYVLHGFAVDRHSMAGFSSALAAEGAVVFATDWRTDVGSKARANDVECGYRFMVETATDHGGDLTQPITIVGWSAGAVLAFQAGLDEEATARRGEADLCALDAPRPDVVVAVAGCLTTWDRDNEPMDPESAGWGNTRAQIVLISGERDTECQPWESSSAVPAFEAAGYDVFYSELDEADHGAVVFFPPDEHGDHRAGKATVQMTVDAIERADR